MCQCNHGVQMHYRHTDIIDHGVNGECGKVHPCGNGPSECVLGVFRMRAVFTVLFGTTLQSPSSRAKKSFSLLIFPLFRSFFARLSHRSDRPTTAISFYRPSTWEFIENKNTRRAHNSFGCTQKRRTKLKFGKIENDHITWEPSIKFELNKYK